MNPQPSVPQRHAQAAAHPHAPHRPASVLARLRPSPARSLLGAGVFARLGLAAAALVLLWTTILWALR